MTNYLNTCKELSVLDGLLSDSRDQNGSGLRDILTTIVVWNNRAKQRAGLKNLDHHMLNDIGLTRDEADIEAAKPFWKL